MHVYPHGRRNVRFDREADRPGSEGGEFVLREVKPRKEENLERGYLRGRYGGIPRVTAGEFAREVARQKAKATA